MSLKTFQRVLVDLTLSPARARALRVDGADALEGLDLTPLERERLLDIVRQPGISVHCSLSRGNRFEVIAEVFPMTCVLLEPILGELLDEVWQTSRPENYQLSGEEAVFAGIVGRKLAAGAVAIEYLDEIFAYETTCWELARRMRMQTDPDAAVEVEVEFQHSPGDLLPPLSRLTAPPPGLPRGSYPARVTLRGERFDVAMLPAAE
ncbi:MAG: hypothetical protein ACRD9L_07380 [Bryobacteraceae bacterium]